MLRSDDGRPIVLESSSITMDKECGLRDENGLHLCERRPPQRSLERSWA